MWTAGRMGLGSPDSLPMLWEAKLQIQLVQNILKECSTYSAGSHYNDSAGEKYLLFVRRFHIHNIKKLMVLMIILATTRFSL